MLIVETSARNRDSAPRYLHGRAPEVSFRESGAESLRNGARFNESLIETCKIRVIIDNAYLL